MNNSKQNSSWLKTLAIGFSIISFGITLAIVGYIVLTTKQNQQAIVAPKVSVTTAPTPNQTTPEKITENFYKSYIECLDYHFRYPSGSPRQDCPFNKFQIISPELLQKLETIKASDPVLCSQNTPKKDVTTDRPTIEADKPVFITVHTYYELSGDLSITVELKNINGEWKITNIICPQEITSR